MSETNESLPIILCGKEESTAVHIIPALSPEIEVIQFIRGREAGARQIPALLRGEKDIPSDSNLGTKNYERIPVAVILGGAYEDEDIEVMRKATVDIPGVKGVPWLRPDRTVEMPPVGPEYGKIMVQRVKQGVEKIKREGLLGKDGIVWY